MCRHALRVAAFVMACGLAATAVAPGRAQTLGDSVRRRAVRELAAGKLLIATRGLTDPNFSKTVVLLVEYSAEGAAGFIVNRPANVTLGRLFTRFASTPAGAAMAFIGGPVVTQGSIAALARSSAGESRRVVDGVYLIQSRERLEEAIAEGEGASRLRVYLGYAGWGAGQLDDETATGAWRLVDGDAAIVFDARSDEVWPRLIARTEALSARAPCHASPGAMTWRAARCTQASSGP
jgi:putative transcriptional regulator